MNLEEGDRVVFIEEEGRVSIVNASLAALRQMQEVMEGKAEDAGLMNEDDVVALVRGFVRNYGRRTMRVMTDTNILVSAFLFPNSLTKRLIERIVIEH